MACRHRDTAAPVGVELFGVIALLYHDVVGGRLMKVEVRLAAAPLERLEA